MKKRPSQNDGDAASRRKQRTPSAKGSADDFSALNSLIHDRAARWSKEARAIKFDIEFRAIEQERRRIAKELHDEILPLLSRLIRSIQANENPDLIDELHSTALAVRDLLGELHPVDLEEIGLVPALDNLCARHARLTGRCVIFAEETEDCHLSDEQQLCIYRAMQETLRMFAGSENDILLVTYQLSAKSSIITVRCVDKRVSSANWLSGESPQFEQFSTWCAMASAKLQFGAHIGEFPCELVLSAAPAKRTAENVVAMIGRLTRIRLRELDTILAVAQEEWADLIKKDCDLFKDLAIDAERNHISAHIHTMVAPHFEKVVRLAAESKNSSLRQEISSRMHAVISSVNDVISEVHPQLLAQAGLLSCIRTLVERFRRESLIETVVISERQSEQIDGIAMEAKFAIYRVVQEALNNIEKHSAATRATVTVRYRNKELVIDIEDNGKGFQEPPGTLSRGLKNINERAREIGARVAWTSAASFQTGTLLTITLPCL